jgi:hypothetical protein
MSVLEGFSREILRKFTMASKTQTKATCAKISFYEIDRLRRHLPKATSIQEMIRITNEPMWSADGIFLTGMGVPPTLTDRLSEVSRLPYVSVSNRSASVRNSSCCDVT